MIRRDRTSFANCQKATKKNIFTKVGKYARKPKKDDQSLHQRSDDHKSAVHAKVLKKNLTTAATNAYVSCKDAIQAQMATILV